MHYHLVEVVRELELVARLRRAQRVRRLRRAALRRRRNVVCEQPLYSCEQKPQSHARPHVLAATARIPPPVNDGTVWDAAGQRAGAEPARREAMASGCMARSSSTETSGRRAAMLGPARDADSTHCLVCARATEPSYTRCRGLSECSFAEGATGPVGSAPGGADKRQTSSRRSHRHPRRLPASTGYQNRTCVCGVTGSGDTSDVIQDLEEKRLR